MAIMPSSSRLENVAVVAEIPCRRSIFMRTHGKTFARDS